MKNALVIEADAGEQVHGPKLLPDGETLLFAVTTASSATRWDEAVLVVQRLEGGERKVVWTGGSDATTYPLAICVCAGQHTDGDSIRHRPARE